MRWLTTAKQFISKTKEVEMVVIELGYKKFVLPRDKAMVLIDCLEGAEIYEEKYWNDEKRRQFGMTETYTYHVYPNDANFSMQIVSDSKYQMARLAGKPQEK
jgi:hypothetical protein